MSVPFWKLQSIGNDFVLFRERDLPLVDLPMLAREVCRRRFGIGSDGLLVYGVGDRKSVVQRMFNPDGSEDFCGNGLRCTAIHAFLSGEVDSAFAFEHLGRRVPAKVLDDGRIETVLPPADWTPTSVPIASDDEWFQRKISVEGWEGEVCVLSTGSAHLVAFVGHLPSDPDFERISAQLEHHPAFPERVSVMWARVDAPDHLTLRIWERGVGETLGCGTGSAAAACAHARRTNFRGRVRVSNPGGDLFYSLTDWTQELRVIGEASLCFSGRIEIEVP